MEINRNKNTDYIYATLTSPVITTMSGGRIPQMTAEQASGLIGSWMVETGDPSLQKLDVVETIGGSGRGMSQYTGVRRIPYDKARSQAIQKGTDPNSAEWQMQYFADEYSGKYDQDGRSLIGWTRSLESLPPGLSPGDYAQNITGSASAGKGYFRPGVPHVDKRRAAAESVYEAYKKPAALPSVPTKPKQKPSGNGNPLSIISDLVKKGLNKLSIPSN